MSKPYIRKRTDKPFVHSFTCQKCGEVFPAKPDFKDHWRATADHDQRVRL